MATIESALVLLRKYAGVSKIFNAPTEHTHCSAVKYFNKHNLQTRTWTHIKLESHKAAELNSPSRNVGREHARGLGLAVGGVHHDVEAGEEIQQFLRQGLATAEEGGFAREAKIFLVTNINQ